MDSIVPNKRNPAIKIVVKKPEPKHKTISILSFFDRKQIVTIAITFVLTFVFSLATSQGLASIHSTGEVSAEQTTSTRSDISISTTDTPLLLQFNENVLTKPDEVYLPREKLVLPDPLKKRKEFLEKYLRSRNSPLADHVDAISEQSQWKLIIAISRAESSWCKRYVVNNCWGIGGAWNMKNYKNFDEAVKDVNRILETYYIKAGLNSPSKIVRKYVGHQSDTWQMAVEQELKNLEEIE